VTASAGGAASCSVICLSQRQAAKAWRFPASYASGMAAYQDSLDEHPAVVAFFHSAQGWLLASSGARNAPGVYRSGCLWHSPVCLLVQLAGLDRFRGLLWGATPVNRQVEEAIVAYRARKARVWPKICRQRPHCGPG